MQKFGTLEPKVADELATTVHDFGFAQRLLIRLARALYRLGEGVDKAVPDLDSNIVDYLLELVQHASHPIDNVDLAHLLATIRIHLRVENHLQLVVVVLAEELYESEQDRDVVYGP